MVPQTDQLPHVDDLGQRRPYVPGIGNPSSKFIWDKKPKCSRTWDIMCIGLYSSMLLSPASGEAVNFLHIWCQSSDFANVCIPPNSCIWGLRRMQGISEEAVLQTHPSSSLNLSQIAFKQGVFVWIAKRSKIEKDLARKVLYPIYVVVVNTLSFHIADDWALIYIQIRFKLLLIGIKDNSLRIPPNLFSLSL